MSNTAKSAFGAVVISLEQHREKIQTFNTMPADQAAPATAKPYPSLLTVLDRYKMDTLQREHLDQDKMLRRSTSALWVHFEEHAGTAYGAFIHNPKQAQNRELVSMMLMREDNDLPPEVQGTLPLEAVNQRHGLIGGALVAEGFEGKGLGKEMLQSCINDAIISHIDHLHARVRIDNPGSLAFFKKAGFTVLPQTGPSPDMPHHEVYFLHLDLKRYQEARMANVYEFKAFGT